MGLFDKKYCDICGEKIGLLGNRKLEDGNLCKDCARKLSPWFSERRSSTVAEIKEQLDWREANRERAAQFRTTRTFGERTKLLLDEQHRWFAVTRESSPAVDNADVLDIFSIIGCRADIDETRIELKMESKDSEGKTVHKSYNPPRYEYDYDFYIILSVNTPYFSEMKFKLNDSRVHIPYQPTTIRLIGGSFLQDRHEEPLYDSVYRGFKEMSDEICRLIEYLRSGAAGQSGCMGGGYTGGYAGAAPVQNGYTGGIGAVIPGIVSSPAADKAVAEVVRISSWTCVKCGTMNHGTATCRQCGGPISDESFLSKLRTLACAASLTDTGAQGGIPMQNAAPMQSAAPAQSWSCPFCGAVNQGKFCEGCGSKKPETAAQCSRCGWKPTGGNLPKFCPECGQPL